jgi:hypothetical protein
MVRRARGSDSMGVPTIADVQHIDLEIERIARMKPELEVELLLGWIDGG